MAVFPPLLRCRPSAGMSFLPTPETLLGSFLLAKPRNKSARRPLVSPILYSARAQRLRFRSRDPRSTQQEIQHQCRRNQPQPSPRRTQRENCIGHPDHPLKKIIRMARIAPQTSTVGLAAVLRILPESIELVVRRGLTTNADQPNRDTNLLQPA
jgi:hypothetical protein